MRTFKTIFIAAGALLLIVGLVINSNSKAVHARNQEKLLSEADVKKQCELLTRKTNTPHHYAKGKILLISDAIPPAQHIKVPEGEQPSFKGYIVKFESNDFKSERTYIRASESRFKNLTPLLKNKTYAFCYFNEERFTAIEHPEFMLLVEE